MTAHRLSRSTYRTPDRPAQPFLSGAGFDDLTMERGRVHEVCGIARRTLIAILAARCPGPIFWIAPSWQAARLNPEGACRLFDPARLTFLDPLRNEDLLWCMEEVLRSGAVPLVVADLPGTPGLTPVRRLHLAAETGGTLTGHWPLGVILTPGQGGAGGVESRWHIAPDHGVNTRRAWRLDRLRARTAPPRTWAIRPKEGKLQIEDWMPQTTGPLRHQKTA